MNDTAMTTTDVPDQRVLAIDPYVHGFAFAVLEGLSGLVDFGFAVTRTDKSARGLFRARDLIETYRPEVLVLENCVATRLRHERVRRFIDDLRRLGRSCGLYTVTVSWVRVYDVFGRCGAQSRHDIATTVVRLFPHMADWLPRRRVVFESQDPRIRLFDAIAFAVTYLCETQSGPDREASRQVSTNRTKSRS